ncbi:MAG: transporter substrate-binding domain-containing protein [Colwellia sp.]
MTVVVHKACIFFKITIKQIIWLTFVFVSQSYACEQRNGSDIPLLVFPPNFDSNEPKKDYIFQLIQLILKKSANKFGPCEAQLLDHKLPIKRIEVYLQKNHLIHAAAFSVSNERNKKLLPVTIPIAKGLMGYRLLMIHKKNINMFAKVNTLSKLAKLVAGQGTGWPDVKILRKNNLPVITSDSIATLVDMLVYDRFDYFPRGAIQIGMELKAHQDKPVMVEPHILLRYPSMTALYVNSSNTKLAKRLEYGLKRVFKDGSFDELFNNHPSPIQARLNLELDKRKIIDICNPILPTWVPLEKPEYWLEPWSEKILQNDCGLN